MGALVVDLPLPWPPSMALLGGKEGFNGDSRSCFRCRTEEKVAAFGRYACKGLCVHPQCLQTLVASGEGILLSAPPRSAPHPLGPRAWPSLAGVRHLTTMVPRISPVLLALALLVQMSVARRFAMIFVLVGILSVVLACAGDLWSGGAASTCATLLFAATRQLVCLGQAMRCWREAKFDLLSSSHFAAQP